VPGWTFDPFAASWEEGFRRLQDYVQRHGDARVPGSYTVDGYRLGQWVLVQRTRHREGTLGAARRRRLEDLNDWTWDTTASRWEQGFRHLEDYVKVHGHALVPSGHTHEGYKLGNWVGNQRSFHDRGTLDPDRQRRLEGVPGWTFDPFAASWEDGFRRLQDYVQRHRDALVPASHREGDHKLGQWVGWQRSEHAKGTLEADRERRLLELPGWTWDPRADQWEEGFSRLQDYVQRHGDARVPGSYTVDGYKLGGWVKTQRRLHAKGTLNADRQHRLGDLPGWI
jgi:hypothetical protein